MLQTLPQVNLPEPRLESDVSIEAALRLRRSIREFQRGPLTIAEVSQLLWAAQGVTDGQGLRAPPSAGALYPLELYLLVGQIATLRPNVYRYDPLHNKLQKTAGGDRRGEMSLAALEQSWIAEAPVILLIAANYRRTAAKYGARAERYVHIEVGHAAENVYLQAGALGLGTTDVGAFEDAMVKKVAALPAQEEPVLLLPIGRRRLFDAA
jgi:SagB-type dehydrogenase family enzyme